MIPNIIAAIIGGIGYLCGSLITRRLLLSHTYEVDAANAELRDRLATVTGQLADARARLDLRIQRAHEGACKAAKTRHAKRIVLPVKQAEGAAP